MSATPPRSTSLADHPVEPRTAAAAKYDTVPPVDACLFSETVSGSGDLRQRTRSPEQPVARCPADGDHDAGDRDPDRGAHRDADGHPPVAEPGQHRGGQP